MGLLAAAALPAAIVVTRWSGAYSLIHAGFAIPVAIVLGAAAMTLARRARARARLTIAGAEGARSVRAGRLLGLTGILIGITGAGAIGVYLVLRAVSG